MTEDYVQNDEVRTFLASRSIRALYSLTEPFVFRSTWV